MAHKANRIERKKLYNIPHLISTESFESIVDYLEHRPDGMLSKDELAIARDIQKEKRNKNLGEKSVGVIPVAGVLTYEETMFGAICGMSSYQGIVAQMEQAVEEGYRTVVLDIDSGGGEAYGTFETAKELRKLANDNNIKLIAYVDGISASAAYGLSVAADEIILNPYAEVGSVGVVTQLVNNSEQLKKEGITRTFVYAGDNKIPFDAEGGWREDFINDIQTKVDMLYDDFVTHVASMRGIDVSVVKDTQAKMFSADKAISLGLADRKMERLEFAEYLADLEEGKQMPLKNLFNKKKEETMSTELLEELTPALIVESADNSEMIATLQAQVAELTAAKAATELAYKTEAKTSFAKTLATYSFVTDSTALADALYEMKEVDKAVVLEVLEAASLAVEATVETVLSIEGEEEADLASEETKVKAKFAADIKAKYTLSDK